jgi:hypothetical protein
MACLSLRLQRGLLKYKEIKKCRLCFILAPLRPHDRFPRTQLLDVFLLQIIVFFSLSKYGENYTAVQHRKI